MYLESVPSPSRSFLGGSPVQATSPHWDSDFLCEKWNGWIRWFPPSLPGLCYSIPLIQDFLEWCAHSHLSILMWPQSHWPSNMWATALSMPLAHCLYQPEVNTLCRRVLTSSFHRLEVLPERRRLLHLWPGSEVLVGLHGGLAGVCMLVKFSLLGHVRLGKKSDQSRSRVGKLPTAQSLTPGPEGLWFFVSPAKSAHIQRSVIYTCHLRANAHLPG